MLTHNGNSDCKVQNSNKQRLTGRHTDHSGNIFLMDYELSHLTQSQAVSRWTRMPKVKGRIVQVNVQTHTHTHDQLLYQDHLSSR